MWDLRQQRRVTGNVEALFQGLLDVKACLFDAGALGEDVDVVAPGDLVNRLLTNYRGDTIS